MKKIIHKVNLATVPEIQLNKKVYVVRTTIGIVCASWLLQIDIQFILAVVVISQKYDAFVYISELYNM